jgi:uncharacterized damage-inducible protein DinB
MSGSLLTDAFAHHSWATLRVMDACDGLSPEQLATAAPGTYGSILDTLRHIVGADSWYLHRLSGERHAPIDDGAEAELDLAALRSAMERQAALWPEVLAADPDPDEFIEVRRDDGSGYRATKGIRLAQVLHHGSDHRSQICTALTSLGVEPPEIGVWEYGDTVGRAVDIPAD